MSIESNQGTNETPNASGQNQLTEAQKIEYQELRDEFTQLNQTISTTVNFSVGGCVAAFGFIFKSFESNTATIFYFLLPILIIIPSCLLIASRIQGVHRIAAYIIVFLEHGTNLSYETLLEQGNFKHKLSLRTSILLIYSGIILFDIALFLSKPFYQFFDFLIYGLSVLVFIFLFFYMNKGWKKTYTETWKELKIVGKKAP